jgi:hypothetical protein
MSKTSTRNHSNEGTRNTSERVKITQRIKKREAQAMKDHEAHLKNINPDVDEKVCESWENGTHCESWDTCYVCEPCTDCERCEDCEDEFKCCENCAKCEVCETIEAEKEAEPVKKSRKNGKTTKAERNKDKVEPEVYDPNAEPKETNEKQKQKFYINGR